MTTTSPRTLCFVSSRNLGDAVIHADFVRALAAANYADRYIVWTFPQAAFLFEGIKACETICSDFPMGSTIRAFVQGGFRSFWSAVRRIRRERPTETLELVSDFRERWVCGLLGASRNVSPEWEPGHPFRKHSRMGRFNPSALVTIPATVTGVYAAYDLVLSALVGTGHTAFSPKPTWPSSPEHIGIHPFASAPCKLWPQLHWLSLIDKLHGEYPRANLVLFGSPSDRGILEELARQTDERTEIFTASLREFKAKLQGIDLLIGLDSFSVHLAHSQRVPTIVLVGPNDPQLFTPPGAKAVTHPGRCVHQPCAGKPKCIGSSFEYICMNSISPTQVVNKIDSKSIL